MNESYTILINSVNYTTSNNGLNSSLNYNFDWSILPDQPYRVHFTYLGEINDLSTGSDIAMIYLNFGCGTNNYVVSTNGYAQTSTFLGYLRPERMVAQSFLYAEDSTNVPIYIKGRPQNNNFTVDILNNANASPLTTAIQYFTPSTGVLAPYVLQLRFVPINKEE